MPTYTHICDNGHRFDLLLRFSQLDEMQHCTCGRPAARVICAPMVFVQQDICYDSPIDGRAITNKQMRLDDMKRHGCVEYDPGMKQDAERRRNDMESALDKSVDETVEREFSTMPTRKLEKLESELRAGAAADVVRITPEQRSA